ncbi:hypothetical protein ACES2I_08850 [Bdellovibrio bacteriovorus]|uniref:hypothetical protein n=1 Tax=Bdellovibrio bacteriovorus TaxID=959 RepID=UPI0035A6083F
MSNRSLCLVAITSLMIGSYIYIAYRPTDLLMFHFFDSLGLTIRIQEVRSFGSTYRGFIPNWVIFCAPNGLWMLSYMALSALVWNRQMSLAAFGWGIVLLAGSILSEFLQLFKLLPGTFDVHDLVAYTVGAYLGSCLGFLGGKYGKAQAKYFVTFIARILRFNWLWKWETQSRGKL